VLYICIIGPKNAYYLPKVLGRRRAALMPRPDEHEGPVCLFCTGFYDLRIPSPTCTIGCAGICSKPIDRAEIKESLILLRGRKHALDVAKYSSLAMDFSEGCCPLCCKCTECDRRVEALASPYMERPWPLPPELFASMDDNEDDGGGSDEYEDFGGGGGGGMDCCNFDGSTNGSNSGDEKDDDFHNNHNNFHINGEDDDEEELCCFPATLEAFEEFALIASYGKVGRVQDREKDDVSYYFLPRVDRVIRGKGREGVEKNFRGDELTSWGVETTCDTEKMVFRKEVCCIIKIDCIVDGSEEPIFICDCFCKHGREGEKLRFYFESFAQEVYAVRQNTTASHLHESANRLLLGKDLLPTPEIKIGFHALHCLHIEALKIIVASKPEVMETAVEPCYDNDSGSLFSLRGATQGRDEFTCLYYARSQPTLTFLHSVFVTPRGVPLCQRYSSSCPCHNLVKDAKLRPKIGIGLNADNIEADKTKKFGQNVRPLQSYKARPLMFDEDGEDGGLAGGVMLGKGHLHLPAEKRNFLSTVYLQGWKLYGCGVNPWPRVAKPTTVCTCNRETSTAENFPCQCRLKCECGNPWGDKAHPCGQLMIHSLVFDPALVDVCYLSCSSCDKRLLYEGYEDGLTVLYQQTPTMLVAIDTQFIEECLSSISTDKRSWTEKADALLISYKKKHVPSIFWMHKKTLVSAIQRALHNLILPHVPRELLLCSLCGPLPQVIGVDGTALGILEVHRPPGFFNFYDDQTIGVSSTHLSGSENKSVQYFQRANPWCKLAFCSGTLSSIGEQLMGFSFGSTQSQKKSPVIIFTEDNAQSLLNAIEEKCANEEDEGRGACKSFSYLISKYVGGGASCIPPELPNLQAIVRSLGSKSMAPICGGGSIIRGGGAVAWAWQHLANGGVFDEEIPGLFLCLKSPRAVSRKEGNHVMSGAADVVPEVIDSDREHVTHNLRLMFQPFHDAYLDPHDSPEGPLHYVSQVTAKVASSMTSFISEQSYHNESLRDTLKEEFAVQSKFTVIDLLGHIFPFIENHLRLECENGVLSVEVRAIAAHFALKSWELWTSPEYYVWTFENESKVTSKILNRRDRNRSLDDIIAAAKASVPGAPMSKERELLKSILQCGERLATTREADVKHGHFCAYPRLDLMMTRIPEYTIDSKNSSVADKAAKTFNSQLQKEYKIDPGKLGVCEKAFPKNKHFTSGQAFITCPCSKNTVLFSSFMDSAESCRTVCNLVMNRYEVAPLVIFYDNACHLQSYCMARDSEYWFNTIFLCDRFHEFNHSTCCRRYKSSEHPFTSAFNSSGVEQVNSVVKTRKNSIAWQGLTQAGNYMATFFLGRSRRQKK
jgi:hypothetical protein